jgi:hypothetical protein
MVIRELDTSVGSESGDIKKIPLQKISAGMVAFVIFPEQRSPFF